MESLKVMNVVKVILTFALVLFMGTGEPTIASHPGPIFIIPATFPSSSPTTLTSTFNVLENSVRDRFDVSSNGSFSEGSTDNFTRGDAYDGAFSMRIFNDTFAGSSSFPSLTASTTAGQPCDPNVSQICSEDSNRELVFGPVTTARGLRVTRKVFMPTEAAHGGVGRRLEIFRNPTASPITIDVMIEGNLGSDDDGELILTSSGDLIANAQDTFAVERDKDRSDPFLGFVIDATQGAPSIKQRIGEFILRPDVTDDFRYVWRAVTIPAGGTVILMHFNLIQGTEQEALRDSPAIQNLPLFVLTGLDKDEINNIANFPVATRRFRNVQGLPGAVPGGSLVTLTNLNKPGETQMTTADGDGSFFAAIDAALNDEIEVRANGALVGRFPTEVRDSDGDGISDLEESVPGMDDLVTDPLNADTDGDGLNDGDEIARGTNPLNPDTDQDGLNDGGEVARGTNPLNPDTDQDGLRDGDEVALGTNPLNPDSDADGFTDGVERVAGTDPRNGASIPAGNAGPIFILPATFPGSSPTTITSLPSSLSNSAGDTFEGVSGNGSFSDASTDNSTRTDAYDGAFFLNIFNDTFAGSSSFPSLAVSTTAGQPCDPNVSQICIEDSNRELVFGPVTTMNGLRITRKAFVPTEATHGGVARRLEIIRNPTSSPLTIDVMIQGDLGSDGDGAIISTSSGDLSVDAQDTFAVEQDQDGSDPFLGFVVDAAQGTRSIKERIDEFALQPSGSDDFQYTWRSITIP
ncbi:MAG: hypothetical protein HY731_00595, partial [Candidatus Tectomicrobia bacterium]|nr:hypothetical protein [Candidatus Tectomicrobia bacterium]